MKAGECGDILLQVGAKTGDVTWQASTWEEMVG